MFPLVCLFSPTPTFPHASWPRRQQYGVVEAAGSAGTRPRPSRSYNTRHEFSTISCPAARTVCRESPGGSAAAAAPARNKNKSGVRKRQQYKRERSTPRRACPAPAQRSGARDSGRETRICVSAGRMGGPRAGGRRFPRRALPARLVRLPGDGRVERRDVASLAASTLTCRYRGRWPLAVRCGRTPRFAR